MGSKLVVAWMRVECRNRGWTGAFVCRRLGRSLGFGLRTEQVSGMTDARRVWALIVGATLVSALAGCSDDPAGTTTPTESPTSSSSPSAPPTSETPTSPSDAATADATSAIRNYFTVVDGLRSDPAAELEQLKSVATSAQLNAVETLVRRQRDEGQRQAGATAINELKVQSVNLDNSAPDAGKVPTVVIDVCWDVSKVDVLDKSGKSIVSPNRPDTGWTRYTVANYEYAADPSGGWRVATGQDLKQTPCAAS